MDETESRVGDSGRCEITDGLGGKQVAGKGEEEGHSDLNFGGDDRAEVDVAAWPWAYIYLNS